ncbi:MAG: DUF2249 domain-containing protein [Nocardioidaceae bacterium]
MEQVAVASNEADSEAVVAVEQHHAQLIGAMTARVDRILDATRRQSGIAATAARDELVAWSDRELLPHAKAEESALYPLAHDDPQGRLLVDAMLADHVHIVSLTDRVRAADNAVDAAAASVALKEVFEGHVAKENNQILPLLAGLPHVSLSDALRGMHQLLGEPAEEPAHHPNLESEATCSCHHDDQAAYPELDARDVPHAIRHATVFGALDAVPTGGGMVLVAPHDPLPLLAQLERRQPGVFEVDYIERGPDKWRLSIVRR